ncbi:hypothetical protein G9A89_008070 [Geosiphon pyriformis]|nr:hypothetical protein G9A89_008070 [Geosiphon pyriformis]
MEETTILQSIGSSDKEKQSALAPREHLNMQTPIPLNITSNIPPINRIMAYQDITKLEKFSGTAIFSDQNCQFVVPEPGRENQFSIIKQKDHEAVTTYLGQFNQILCQILAIERDYYTVAQVLNQFIKELQSSILRSVRSRHPTSLQDTIALTCNFESITQLSEKLTQKIKGFLARTTEIYQPPQWRENNNNSRYPQQQNHQQQQQPWRSDLYNCYYCQKPGHIARDYRKKIMDQNQGNSYQQPRYQQNMVPQYFIPQNQLPLYTQQVPYTQPPPQNYYQPPPITQAIPHYQISPYSPSKPRAIDYNQGWRNSNNNQLGIEDLNSETLATYFHKLNFNIIKYCEETYPVQSQYTIDFELETETSNKDKNKLKQYSRTTPNTPTLPKTTAKHLQTPEQRTSSKLPLTITSFPASLTQAQTPNSLLNQFARPEDFTSLKSSTKQQELLQTSSNLLDFLAENQSEHSETAANEENNSEITEEESIDSENEENEMTTYIAKIPEFNGEDIETSPQEWLDQVTKAGDANGWNAARMLRTIPYFLKGTAGEWFENLATPFNNWNAFKAAFLEQFTDNNTSITFRNRFRNIKQEPSKSVMTYIGKFNKLLRRICQLETNDYYSDAQILDQFITGLKDKLIKKVCPHVPEDLNSAIQYAKRYEMAIKEANCTKLVNLAIGETSSAAEEKIDQLTKKVENYFTNQQQQPQRYQPPQRRNQNNFAPLSNNQPQNCHYCGISGHWKRDCKKLQ